MLRKVLGSIGILTMIGVAGCIDDTTVVTVDKTGAGTVVKTTYMSKAMQDMMAQMAGAMGGQPAGGAAPAKNAVLEDNEKYKTKAAAMGEGVTFVSAKEVTKADGSAGAQVTYAFKDVNKLKFNSEPEAPAGGGTAPGNGRAKKADTPVTFHFVKGPTAKLTIMMPQKTAEPVASAEKTPSEATTPPPEQIAEIKQMFDGFRARVIVKVDGDITKSNAAFVEKDSTTGKKQVVTLVDMDLGKIVKDDAMFKKLAAMGEIKDMATAKEKMKDIPGLRFEPAEKVEIDFK